MDTSLEHTHELAPHIKAGRARACVLLLILSDALSVLALLAGGGYLSALNTLNQYKVEGYYAPPWYPGIAVAVGLGLSGLAYYLWQRNAHKPVISGEGIFFLIAVVLMLATGIADTVMGINLHYPDTIMAYESLQLLIIWFAAIHLLLAAIIGILLFGRILRKRLVGYDYIPEVVGYWWYYTIISTILLWLFGAFLL